MQKPAETLTSPTTPLKAIDIHKLLVVMHILSHYWLRNVVEYLKLEIIAFGFRIARRS